MSTEPSHDPKKNYIIPLTNNLFYEDEAQSEAVEVDTVTKEMENAENRLNILVLDRLSEQ